jgi:hypothetical protein
VNQLTITHVVPGPLLQLEGVTLYSGHVGLARNNDFRGIVRATDLEPCSFFLPDSAPYTEVPAGLAVETSLRTIRTLGNPTMVVFGAHDAQVAVVPDPRGTDHQWLQVSFGLSAISLEQVEINYRVTVQP